jgi:transcriptional regulator with XRE-family HTH domain
MKYPNRIAGLRKSRGITQGQLAEKIGATLSMIGKLERGERKLNSLWTGLISDALKVPESSLLDDTVEAVGFGEIDHIGFVQTPGSEHLEGDKDALFNLFKQPDIEKSLDGEPVVGFRNRFVELTSALKIPLPEGTRFLFRPTHLNPGAIIGTMCIISARSEAGQVSVVGVAYPGSEPSRHHILPLNGAMIMDAIITSSIAINEIELPSAREVHI